MACRACARALVASFSFSLSFFSALGPSGRLWDSTLNVPTMFSHDPPLRSFPQSGSRCGGGQPLAHLRMLAGRIVVDDGVDHFSHRDLLLDRVEEADELLV